MSAENLICPCGKEVYPEVEYGVLVFKHKDSDNYCAYMNKFDTTVGELTYKKIKVAMKECDHEEFLFLMNASDCSIEVFCQDLANSDKGQIKKKLRMLLDIEEAIEGISEAERHFKFILKRIDNMFVDTSFILNYKYVGSTLILEVAKENMKNGAQKSVEGKFKMKMLSSFINDLVNPFSIQADLQKSMEIVDKMANKGNMNFNVNSIIGTQTKLKNAIKSIKKMDPNF